MNTPHYVKEIQTQQGGITETFAIHFGDVLLIVGLLSVVSGFLPGDGLRFAAVDWGQGISLIVIGVMSIAVGLTNEKFSRLFFQIVGVLSLAVTVLYFIGFSNGLPSLFGLPMQKMSFVLYGLSAAVALFAGFSVDMVDDTESSLVERSEQYVLS